MLASTAPRDMRFFGDFLATSAMAHGFRAMVIEAGVRGRLDARGLRYVRSL